MAKKTPTRAQTISRIVEKCADKDSDFTARLWEPLIIQLVSIIGEGGFEALYGRSLYLTKKVFPWLMNSPSSLLADSPFTSLKISLVGRSSNEAQEVNNMLLVTFTDILATLIGELLMTRIISSAWRDDATDLLGKECPHE